MERTRLPWRARGAPSLPEVHRTVAVDPRGALVRRVLAFAGPGYLVAVGYMDPGNWATGVAAGSAFGTSLLWVILLSNLMAITLQALAVRLGIATGRDLAQACRAAYSPPVALALWILCELSICATDLAEVIGTAMALELLFGIPIAWGVCITAVDVIVLLWLQRRGFRYLEAVTIALIGTILTCFMIELALAHPDPGAIARGLVPDLAILAEPDRLYLAIGIIGATVMPHNLYLHSSIVQTRRYPLDLAGRTNAVRLATLDLVAALLVAVIVNAAIVVLAAAAFHATGHAWVAELGDAYRVLSPVLGAGAASVLFGVALLASGKSSTLTATLTGQIVMEGFLALRLAPWLRRLITRGLAILPALVVVAACGEHGLAWLLIASQAVLSFQLPFAVFPLIRLTSDRRRMGQLVSPIWLTLAAWGSGVVIAGLNTWLLVQLVIR
ncbi:MAG TPA: Nramp family divalent metal transporter [Kofleriaceae bacterium]|jgi:manganese transport protein|nr:Nramp family divalent metal transporter [Kofleriaceae bacterium]